MRKGSYLVTLVLILTCFGLGCLSIYLPRDPDPPSPEATRPYDHQEQPFVQIPHEENTSSILILGVDRIQDFNPNLIAIWLATVQHSSKDVHLFGYPIHLQVPAEEGAPLHELFTFSPQAGVSTDFLHAFNTINILGEPETIVVIDEAMFASLVDYVGGVHVGDTILSGEIVVSFQKMLYDDPHGLLISQHRVLDNLRHQLRNLKAPLDVTSLINLSKEHAYVSMDSEHLALWISTFLPADPKGIRVQVFESTLLSSSVLALP